jgi:thiamine-phosphate pyrophosphorylase
MQVRGYYAIAEDLVTAKKLVHGGAAVLQLRHKQATSRELVDLAQAFRALTREAGIPFVMNDRLDVALVVDADAVHLGQDDLPLEAARRVAGGRLAVGISTHTPEQAEAFARAGADYLGFGPVYATATKENPDPVQGLAALAEAVRRAAPVPVVAIGGITLERASEVAATGVAGICVISAVNGAPDPVAAARRIAGVFS